jgi:ubiquinone/menaquinone biosynthesis C-methylase UbiE
LQSAETHGYTVVTGDMHDLPFADGVFDCVASKHTLEHSLLPMVAIEETKRVLKPGGLFILVTPPGHWDANAGHFVQGWNKLHLSYLIAVCGFEVLASDEKGWSASVLGRKVADGYEGVDFNIIAARWRKPEAK